jgi:molybdopterin synthase catalytic subunit
MKNAGVHEKGTVSIADAMENIRRRPDFHRVGALVTFTGVVRGSTVEGKVQKLELQAYEEKADEVLVEICNDLRKKPGIVEVQIHHLLGEFEVGEDLVYVLVAGEHRQQVFPVLEEAVERYKREVPIFKKESVTTREGRTKAFWKTE